MLWIAHEDALARDALVALAGAPAWSGAPETRAFADAPPPDAVVLHVAPELEGAVAFAQHVAARYPRAGWLLVHDPALAGAEVERSFAGLAAERIAWPPSLAGFTAALARARARGMPTATLGGRRERDALLRRFAAWFADLDLAPVLRADPAALLLRGEPGVGRLLLARTLHALGDAGGGFVHIACDEAQDAASLLARIRDAGAGERPSVYLDSAEALPAAVQRTLAGWIELGLPHHAGARWIAAAGELAGSELPLTPTLEDAFRFELRLPPLRERPGAALRIAELALAEAGSARTLADDARSALANGAWLGNAREVERALRRALARVGTAPLGAADFASPLRPAARAIPSESNAIDLSRFAVAPPSAPREESLEAALVLGAAGPSASELARALARDLAPLAERLLPLASAAPETNAQPEQRRAQRELARLSALQARLAAFADAEAEAAAPVQLASLVEAVLVDRKAELQRRRLIALRELDAEGTRALVGPTRARLVLEALLDTAIAGAAERGDVFVSCKRAAGRVRVSVRFRPDPRATAQEPTELVLAREAVARDDGDLSVQTNDPGDRVLSFELSVA